ncbi:hypothetical protein ABPG77_009417 [Micractinium sp. CCAP 211/92]
MNMQAAPAVAGRQAAGVPPACMRACSPREARRMAAPGHFRQQSWRRQGARLVPGATPPGAEPLVDKWGQPIEEGEIGIMSDDFYAEAGIPDGVEGKAGYTPYDFIDFTDIPLKHELVTKVDRPVSEVYALWADRLNWPDWFGMIEEVGFREDDDSLCALNMWYRWAMTPWLELYVALRRTKAEVDKYIVEEPQDGAPIVAAALFQEAEGGAATLVTLRVSYLLPRVLLEYAGQMAVYGDVDRKLSKCMARMKECIEGSDSAAALASGQANMAAIRQDLPEHHKQQAESDARWEAEKRRFAAQQQQQAAAAAAAAAQNAGQAEGVAAEEPSGVAVATAGSAAAAPAAPKAKRGRKSSVTSSGKQRRSARKPAAGDEQ